jgi:hypothetical protein
MLLTQTHRSASTIVSHWFGPLVQNSSWGESGASVGLAPLHLRVCGVKGHSPPPWRCERLLLVGSSKVSKQDSRWTEPIHEYPATGAAIEHTTIIREVTSRRLRHNNNLFHRNTNRRFIALIRVS